MSDSLFIDQITANSVFSLGDDGLLANAGQKSGRFSKSNKLATRGNELFITDGTSIRWAELGAKDQTYKLLDLSLVKFAIEALEINQTGTMLAIIGLTEIVSCVLPSHNTIVSSGSLIPVKVRKVGGYFLSDTTCSQLRKVIWNPTGRYDSNLVTLTSDAIIRSFDLCISYEQPEFTFDLTTLGSGGANTSFSTNTIIDPISIAFGASSDVMGLITLYVLSSDGDLYSLCPWIPSQAVLSRETIEQMFDFAVSMEQEARKPNTDTNNNNNTLRRRYLRQLDWVSSIWNQIPLAITETRFSLTDSSVANELLIIKKPVLFSNIVPAGPYAISPFPEELYEGDAFDFASIDIGPMPGLIVAYSNGMVATLLCENSTVTYFAEDAIADRYDSDEPVVEILSLVENIQLPLQTSLIYQTAQIPFCFFVVDETSIYRVDFASWAVPFSDAVNQGDLDKVESILQSGIESSVLEVNKSPRGFTGRAVITDKSGLPYLLTYDGKDASLAVALDESRVFNRANVSINDKDVEAVKSVSYESLLSKPYVDVEKLLSNVKTSPPRPLLGTIPLNQTMKQDGPSLNQFSTIANFYSEQITTVHKASFWMHKRMVLQLTEYRRQIKKIKEFEDKLKDLASRNNQFQLIEAALDRQRLLSKRADNLLDQLSSKYTLPLSENEKKWFDEVNRVQTKLNDKRGLQARVEAALEQGKIVLNKANNILEGNNHNDNILVEDMNSVGSLRLTQDKIDRLKDLLVAENHLVENTKTLLTNMLHATTQELAQLCV